MNTNCFPLPSPFPHCRLANRIFAATGRVLLQIGIFGLISTALAQSGGPVVGWGGDDAGQIDVPPGETNIIAIAAGTSHSLALRANGTVRAWGGNYLVYGETNVPSGLSNVVAIAAGGQHCLALRRDGLVVAWGRSDLGQNNVPPGFSAIAVADGYSHCLALQTDGTVVAWGQNGSNQTNVPPGLNRVVAIAAGYYHSLALRRDGTVVAWGHNFDGQTTIPPGLSNVVAIAAGYAHSVALRSDGTIVTWGDSGATRTNASQPLPTDTVAVSAGAQYSLALRSDGSLLGWGSQTPFSATGGLTNVVAIAAGGTHGLAIAGPVAPVVLSQPADQTVLLGNPTMLSSQALGTLPMTFQWRFNEAEMAGATNSVLLLEAFRPEQVGRYSVLLSNAWGWARSGTASLTVTQEPPNIVVQPVDRVTYPGGAVSFSVNIEGAWPCWYQWLHDGAVLPQATETTLRLTNVGAAQAGAYSVQVSNALGGVISSAGRLTLVPVVAWGDNRYGQLELIPALSNVVQVAAGGYHSLGLKPDGTVVAWGYNASGQTTVPPGLSNVIALAAGRFHSLALQRDGIVVAWGLNSMGQTTVPNGLNGVMAISAGDSHCVGLRTNGTVVAWGWGSYGQTGVPIDVTNTVAIASGDFYNLALQDDGRVVAWGGAYGPNDPPTGLAEVVAIAAKDSSLARKRDGSLVAWGTLNTSVPVPPAVANGAVAIAADMVLQTNGTVVAWDYTGQRETNCPVSLTNVVSIARGGSVDAIHRVALLGQGGPVISLPPVTCIAFSGAEATLFAGAVGNPPLSYQWQYDGTNLPGATEATLELSGVQLANAGPYRVVVSNAFGQAQSAVASLRVRNQAPFITLQPQSQLLARGGTAVFHARTDGSRPQSLQWLRAGAVLPGATNDTLVIPNVGYAHMGLYSLQASNAFGTALSSNAMLQIRQVLAWGDNSIGQANIPPILRRVTGIAAGAAHNLVLTDDGNITAWGQTYQGQSTVPASATNVRMVAAGWSHSLALRSNGTVVAWGDNSSGQINVPTLLNDALAVAGGASHSLALRRDGTVLGWGALAASPPGLAGLRAIAAGGFHNLGLGSNGLIYAWGNNTYGQTDVPTNLRNAIGIAAGLYHSMALLKDGSVVIWGQAPDWPPPDLSNVVAMAAGGVSSTGAGNALALLGDGNLVAWGPSWYDQNAIPAEATNVIAIAAGGWHHLALFNDGSPHIGTSPASQITYVGTPVTLSAAVWGDPPFTFQWSCNGVDLPAATNATFLISVAQTNHSGRYQVVVGNPLGQVSSREAVLVVLEGTPVIVEQPVDITTWPGGRVVFMVNSTGPMPQFFQWQFNGEDLVGATYADLILRNLPATYDGVYRVILRNSFGTTVSQDAHLFILPIAAWGDDSAGQREIPNWLRHPVAISVGYVHSLAATGEGNVVAWGDNSFGQCDVPPELAEVIAVAAGADHSLALKRDGTVMGWGNNDLDQISVPANLAHVVAISAGWVHSMALTEMGTVFAWGAGMAGEGFPNLNQSRVPPGLSGVVAIAAGAFHSLALKSDGTVVAWGDDGSGQIDVPPGLAGVMAIAAGANHSIALKSDGSVVAWGDDWFGQAEVPMALENIVAIAAGGTHSLALRADGSLSAWGGASGQAEIPLGLGNVTAIAAGGLQSLALVGDGPPRWRAQLENWQGWEGHFSLWLPTQCGKVYQLEYQEVLGNRVWLALPLAAGNGGRLKLTDPSVLGRQRYYRVRQW